MEFIKQIQDGQSGHKSCGICRSGGRNAEFVKAISNLEDTMHRTSQPRVQTGISCPGRRQGRHTSEAEIGSTSRGNPPPLRPRARLVRLDGRAPAADGIGPRLGRVALDDSARQALVMCARVCARARECALVSGPRKRLSRRGVRHGTRSACHKAAPATGRLRVWRRRRLFALSRVLN